ncbi:uncharacterized protein [Physcomitrium patens]|nr:uncharacterized protein LOC112286408 [Physcomitrium patens]XP_024384038.1 uncharacterized protein LOC112286408 [Physcomitrium patens]PNR47864.1 hypothetical protein PHYPA_012337 [Physcomitrium patens]|eukprot:XP_024384037.1 uncharacterized protein LOC112286408 [Physcomitrella patens]
MSRPMALVLVLLVLVLTSQSDWKQEGTVDNYDNYSSTVSKQEVAFINLEVVRKEIILMQEKEIYDLNLQIKSLKEQLKKCQFEVPSNSSSKVADSERQSHTRSARRDELDEPVVEKSAKLRGSSTNSRSNDFPERPSELSATIDALEIGDDDEEKIGDR